MSLEEEVSCEEVQEGALLRLGQAYKQEEEEEMLSLNDIL